MVRGRPQWGYNTAEKWKRVFEYFTQYKSRVSRPTLRETKQIQIKLATTCDKCEQQQDGKNTAEL
jgi:hypothetical protein